MDTLNKISEVLDNNIRITKNFGYLVAGVGLVIIARKAKLFTKFKAITAVPTEFIDKGIHFRGVIKKISNDNALSVEHIPSFSLPFSSVANIFKKSSTAKDELLLDFGGLSLAEEGKEKTREELTGRTIWFQLLTKVTDPTVPCPAVIYIRKRFLLTNYNLFCVKMGYGVVENLPLCNHVKTEQKLRKQLMKAQKTAVKKKRGVWKEDLS